MKRVESGYLLSVAMILLVTGLAVLVSATGQVQVLELPDPLLPMNFRHLLVVVGGLEFASAVALLAQRAAPWRLGLVAWLATLLITYRLGLAWLGASHPCGCLGTVASVVNLHPATVDSWMRWILGYFALGSAALIVLRHWMGDRGSPCRGLSGHGKPSTPPSTRISRGPDFRSSQ